MSAGKPLSELEAEGDRGANPKLDCCCCVLLAPDVVAVAGTGSPSLVFSAMYSFPLRNRSNQDRRRAGVPPFGGRFEFQHSLQPLVWSRRTLFPPSMVLREHSDRTRERSCCCCTTLKTKRALSARRNGNDAVVVGAASDGDATVRKLGASGGARKILPPRCCMAGGRLR